MNKNGANQKKKVLNLRVSAYFLQIALIFLAWGLQQFIILETFIYFPLHFDHIFNTNKDQPKI